MGLGEGLGSIGGAITILAGGGGKGGDRYRKAAVRLWQKIQEDPGFDFSDVPAPVLEVFAEMFPETYNEVIVGQAQQVADSPEMRASQVRGLKQFEALAQEGLPLAERLAAQNAQEAVGREAWRGQEAVLEDLAQRGRLGAGDELAARLAANQSAQNLAAGYGTDLGLAAAENRIAGARQAAQLGGQIRGQDIGLRDINAGYESRFNELASMLGTQRAAENARARERAQQYNVETRQNVGEANALNKYQADLENLRRKNAYRQQIYDNLITKTQGLTGAYLNRAEAKDEERRRKEAAIMQMHQGAGKVGDSAGGLIGGLM